MNTMEREVWETLQQMVAEGSVVVAGHDEEGRELYALQEHTITTPLPWQVGGYDGKEGVTYITGPSGELVAGMGDAGYEPDKQTPRNNAELIVHAVNTYEDLVGHNRMLQEDFDTMWRTLVALTWAVNDDCPRLNICHPYYLSVNEEKEWMYELIAATLKEVDGEPQPEGEFEMLFNYADALCEAYNS